MAMDWSLTEDDRKKRPLSKPKGSDRPQIKLRTEDVQSMASWKSSLGSSQPQKPSLQTEALEVDNMAEGESDDNTLKLILMLLLQLSSRVRDIESCTLYTLFIQKDSQLITSMENTHLAYLAAVEAEGKQHTRGPPSLHRFMALVDAVAAAEVKPGLQPLQQAVKDFGEDMRKSGMDIAIEAVGLCKVMKAYDINQKKVVFSGPGLIKVGDKQLLLDQSFRESLLLWDAPGNRVLPQLASWSVLWGRSCRPSNLDARGDRLV